MTDVLDRQESYNSIAMKYAARMQALKDQRAKLQSTVEPTLESLIAPFNRSALGVHLEYERMGNQPVSDELQYQAEQLDIEFEHLGMTLGTVIHNVDLKQNQSAELTRFIRQALLERKVIFFRDQHLDEDQQVAFSRGFGDLDVFPFGISGTNPYILEIRHGKHSPGTENGWHTDVTWMEQPSLGSVAQCVTVPPYGGDTLFSDSHACYLGLPPAIQQRLQYVSGVNDYRIFMMGRGSAALPENLVTDYKQEIPFGVSHPLLRTHPETAKTGLYIHGGFLRHDSLYDVRSGEPLANDEAKNLVQFLLQQHAMNEYTCRFKWQAGSIAFWDNRAVQHYAASDYYPHNRLLRRVTVSGDKPYYDGAPAV